MYLKFSSEKVCFPTLGSINYSDHDEMDTWQTLMVIFMMPRQFKAVILVWKKREFLANLPFLAIPMGLFSCLKFEPLVQFVEKGKEINVSLYYESQ